MSEEFEVKQDELQETQEPQAVQDESQAVQDAPEAVQLEQDGPQVVEVVQDGPQIFDTQATRQEPGTIVVKKKSSWVSDLLATIVAVSVFYLFGFVGGIICIIGMLPCARS